MLGCLVGAIHLYIAVKATLSYRYPACKHLLHHFRGSTETRRIDVLAPFNSRNQCLQHLAFGGLLQSPSTPQDSYCRTLLITVSVRQGGNFSLPFNFSNLVPPVWTRQDTCKTAMYLHHRFISPSRYVIFSSSFEVTGVSPSLLAPYVLLSRLFCLSIYKPKYLV